VVAGENAGWLVYNAGVVVRALVQSGFSWAMRGFLYVFPLKSVGERLQSCEYWYLCLVCHVQGESHLFACEMSRLRTTKHIL